jgi:hypothetical protein
MMRIHLRIPVRIRMEKFGRGPGIPSNKMCGE